MTKLLTAKDVAERLQVSQAWVRTPNRVGRLRGYGNALNGQQAIRFIEAYLEIKSQLESRS